MSQQLRHWRSLVGLFLVAALVTCPAIAKKGMDGEKPALHYLAGNAVDYRRLLPSPPSEESAEREAELGLVLKVQEQRTPEEIDRAKSEEKLTIAAFQGVVGPWLTEENLPLTAKLVNDATKDSKLFVAVAKDHFARPRPLHDPRVKSIFPDESDFSYPSGHSTRGILIASILSELDPSHRKALMDRGREIGWDRVIAGVHYPSDVMAGRIMGQALYQAMSGDAQFQADLEAAKAEFAEVRKKQP